MPYDFEVSATNCELAREILNVGMDAWTAARDWARSYSYDCVEYVIQTPSASQIFLTLYLAGLIPAIIGWAVLYRRGASPDELFKWGICCVLLPGIGPFVALLGFLHLSGDFGRFPVAGSMQEVDGRNADNSY